MTLIKIYEYGDGSVIAKYNASVPPYQNEKIYLGERAGIVKEVAHVIEATQKGSVDVLQWVEVGIEFI